MLPLLSSCIRKVSSCFYKPQPESEKSRIATEYEQAKFVRLGFPKEVTSSHPECVHFLIQSGIAYAIAMFKNSTQSGQNEHDIRLDIDKHPLIKMQGQWQRWEHVESLLEFDKEDGQVVSKGNHAIKWNYISPDGFVQKGMYEYDEIYPVEQLSQDEYAGLIEHSKKFWDAFPEVDVGEAKDCVIQLVSTERNGGVERNWFNENYLDNMPGHTSLRIIDKTGAVYSFGFVLSEDQSKRIRSSPFTYLQSGKINMATYDYEETRSFDARRVTSIPLTSLRKEKILSAISNWNREGIRFNYIHQNCTKASTVVLDMAGVHIDTRITFRNFILRNFPDISYLPGYEPLSAAVQKIQEAVAPIFETIDQYIPTKPITNFFSWIGEGLSFVPRKLTALAVNSLVVLFGGASESAPFEEGKNHHSRMDDDKFVDFKALICTVGDMFEDEKSDSYHSAKLPEWQKKQSSTVVYKYEGPKMYMLPV